MDARKMRVKDLMQVDVKKVDKNAKLLKAAKMMHDSGVSSLIIEPDADGVAFGIITRKDIVEILVADEFGGASNLVEDIMNKPAVAVSMDFSVYNCQQLMRMVGVRRLPVVDGNNLVGILSNSDIFRKMVSDLK